MANKMAEETENGVMVQDTAWDGYEKFRLDYARIRNDGVRSLSTIKKVWALNDLVHVLFKLVSAV